MRPCWHRLEFEGTIRSGPWWDWGRRSLNSMNFHRLIALRETLVCYLGREVDWIFQLSMFRREKQSLAWEWINFCWFLFLIWIQLQSILLLFVFHYQPNQLSLACSRSVKKGLRGGSFELWEWGGSVIDLKYYSFYEIPLFCSCVLYSTILKLLPQICIVPQTCSRLWIAVICSISFLEAYHHWDLSGRRLIRCKFE
jgi:hypothetical protein